MAVTIARNMGGTVVLPPAPAPAVKQSSPPNPVASFFGGLVSKVENSAATLNRDAQNSLNTAKSVVGKTVTGITTKVQNSEATAQKLALNIDVKTVDSMNTLVKKAQDSSATAKKVLENSSATVKKTAQAVVTKVENSGKTAMADVGKGVSNSLSTIGKGITTAEKAVTAPLTDIALIAGAGIILLLAFRHGG